PAPARTPRPSPSASPSAARAARSRSASRRPIEGAHPSLASSSILELYDRVRWSEIAKLDCTIARTLSVIGDRWTLLVLRDAFLGTRRFEAFQGSLGITRHRLADRLAKLVRYGVLRRERYQDRPRRFEYRLTEKGL